MEEALVALDTAYILDPAVRRSRPSTHDQELLELPFDQYQRYRLMADLCAARRRSGMPLRILDVGGRTGLLRRFLPSARVELVDMEPSSEEGLVLGTGERLPFATNSFDVVTAADTLEHVAVENREAFVKECCRTARGWVVLAGPYQHPAVQEAEEVLQGFLREKLQREHAYLNEHRELGLPDLEQTRTWCQEAGALSTHAVGHGSLDRWVGLLSLELYMEDEPGLRELAKRFYRFYSTLLYPTDRYGVVYRHALVASMDGDAPPSAEDLFGDAQMDAKAHEALGSAVTQLAGFDRERDLFQAERDRLEKEAARGRQNVAGHTASLEVAEADLTSHVKALEVAHEDLSGHRASLASVEKDLASHVGALEVARADLKGHREVVQELRREQRESQLESQLVVEELRAGLERAKELEGHLNEAQAAQRRVQEEYTRLLDERAEFEAELHRVHSMASHWHEQWLHDTRWRRKMRGWSARLLKILKVRSRSGQDPRAD